jgi:hypothetical protein
MNDGSRKIHSSPSLITMYYSPTNDLSLDDWSLFSISSLLSRSFSHPEQSNLSPKHVYLKISTDRKVICCMKMKRSGIRVILYYYYYYTRTRTRALPSLSLLPKPSLLPLQRSPISLGPWDLYPPPPTDDKGNNWSLKIEQLTGKGVELG